MAYYEWLPTRQLIAADVGTSKRHQIAPGAGGCIESVRFVLKDEVKSGEKDCLL